MATRKTAIAQAIESAVTPVVEETVITVAQAIAKQCAATIGEIFTSKSIVETANNALKAANLDKLSVMASIWQHVKGMTGERFDLECKQVMFDTYKASYASFDTIEAKAENVIKVRISQEKVAIIALSNGTHLGKDLMPIAGETLTPYVKRVNVLIQQKSDTVPALYTPKSGARPQAPKTNAGDTDTDKSKPVKSMASRNGALSLLCKGDAADMQMLDMLTSHNMPQVRSLYAMLYPIKTK
jgi:hypothetical protein